MPPPPPAGTSREHPQLTDQTIFTGDNLPVLCGLDSDSVDLIYLDPPFNSNRNYDAPIGSAADGAHFKDRWTLDDLKVEEVGLLAETNEPLADLIRAAGRIAGKGVQAYLTYMAMRLIEMHRILKDTGVIMLHCDDAMGSWLDTLLEAIFGTKRFINEIIWKRHNAKGGANRFARLHDKILIYGKQPKQHTFSRPPLEPEEQQRIAKTYNHKDEHGCYRADNISAPYHGTEKGNYIQPWRNMSPTRRGQRVWRGPPLQTFPPSALQLLPDDFKSRDIHEKLDLLNAAQLLHWTQNGRPLHKRYLTDNVGNNPGDIVTHIAPIILRNKEATGYPTQKPVALLLLLVQAFSNPGDFILDPFCGCATTLIAAQDTGRRWCGIDLSPRAVNLVQERLAKEVPLFTGKVSIRNDIPERSDHTPPPTIDSKHVLYGQQEGYCKGCKVHFPFRNLTVDHIVPRVKGGTDHANNLQLLCAACNSTKGDRPMAYLLAQLRLRSQL